MAAGYNESKGDQEDTTAVNYRHPSAVLQPKWNLNAGIQYGFTLGSGARITPRVDWTFQSYRWQQKGTATLRSGAPTTGRVGTPARPREWSITVSKNFQ